MNISSPVIKCEQRSRRECGSARGQAPLYIRARLLANLKSPRRRGASISADNEDLLASQFYQGEISLYKVISESMNTIIVVELSSQAAHTHLTL